MSDFEDAIMPTPDPEPEPETEAPESEPVEPEPEPEPVWKKYGFETEEAFDKKVSNLSAWEREVNRKASTLGAQEKQQIPAEIPEPSDDLWDDLDPATAKKLKAAIQKEAAAYVESTVGPQAKVAEEMFNDNAADVFKSYAETEGIDADELYAFMGDNNLFPDRPSISALKQKLDLAASAFRGRNVDAIVEKRLAEEMGKLKKDGAEVKAVEPAAKKEPETPGDDFLATDFLGKLRGLGSGKW